MVLLYRALTAPHSAGKTALKPHIKSKSLKQKRKALKAARLAMCSTLLTLACISGTAQSADDTAQNFITLEDNTKRVFTTQFTLSTHETQSLTARQIKLRLDDAAHHKDHKNQRIQTYKTGKIIPLGFNPAPTWMRLQTLNYSNTENWLLDLGHNLEGRSGALKALKVIKYAENGQENRIIDWEQSTSLSPPPWPLPIKLKRNNKETLLIYADFAQGAPVAIVPSLIAQERAHATNHAELMSNTLITLNLLGIGLFIAFMMLTPNSITALSGIYVAINFTLALLTTLQPTSILLLNNITTSALYAALALIIFTLWTITTRKKNALDTRNDERIKKHFNTAFIIALASATLATTTQLVPQINNAIANNAFIYLFPLQIILLALGSRRYMRLLQRHTSQQLARENRATQALARLQQSKDATDQARLLRVIERERELMRDLREQEQDRAEEMRKAKEEADSANAAKSAFLAVVSHEIRTPMNGIMGILKLLQGTNVSEEQADYLLTMQKTGDTMVALLNDILDFEKIEDGSMELEHIPIDLHMMLKGIVTLMTGYIKGKNVQLVSDFDPALPRFVMGDPTRMQQVLFNLTSNALKFTEQGSVTIKLSKAEASTAQPDLHNITFSVIDTGIGISKEAQKTLFEPFKQADKSTARKYGGTGLGLAICMRLVNNMGSKIEIESELNKGTRFFFTLKMEEGFDETGANANQEQQQTGYDQQPNQPIKPTIDPRHVTIVEDNEINRKVLKSLLEKDGHTVQAHESAESLLASIQTTPTDVIFTDINLPGINGMEATRKIRAMTETPKVAVLPIIGLTGNVSEQDIENMRQAGLNGALPKPLDYNKVQDILEKIKPASRSEDDASKQDDAKPITIDTKTQTTTPKTNHENTAPQNPEEAPASTPITIDTTPDIKTGTPIQIEATNQDEAPATQAPMPPYTPAPPQTQAPSAMPAYTPAPPSNEAPTAMPTYTPAPPQNDAPQAMPAYTPAPPSNEVPPIMPSYTPQPTHTEAQNTVGTSEDFAPEILTNLLNSLGKETLTELLQDCITQAAEIINAMSEEGKSTDLPYMQARMHELKGMCHNFGMKKLGDLAGKGEKAAKDNNQEATTQALTELTQALQPSTQSIKEWLNAH